MKMAAAQPTGVEEVESCDLCGSSARETILADARDRSLRLPGSFGLVRCRECGLVRLSPRPDSASLPSYYPDDRYAAYRSGSAAARPGRRLAGGRDALRAAILRALGYEGDGLPAWARLVPERLPRWVVRRAAYDFDGFPAWVSGGRALDLGCGNGSFLSCLRRHGWDVVGVDASPAAAEAARTAFGIAVHVGTVEDAPLEERSLDFAHMSHVIEHLDRPVATLGRIARLLRPGGRLYVETPNVDSLAFRWARQYWFPLETPRHLWLFSAETLARALERAGFAVDRIEARGHPSSFAWAATYRREEEEGRLLPRRPETRPRDVPRAAALAAASRGAGRLSPRRGEILSCWAELC